MIQHVVRVGGGSARDTLSALDQVAAAGGVLDRTEALEDLMAAIVDADPTFVNFLELLIEKHRVPVIFRVRRQFDALYDKEHKQLPVEVTSAIALDDSVVQALEQRVREQTGQNVQLTSNVDPDILGGIVLRVGNSILDASIR